MNDGHVYLEMNRLGRKGFHGCIRGFWYSQSRLQVAETTYPGT